MRFFIIRHCKSTLLYFTSFTLVIAAQCLTTFLCLKIGKLLTQLDMLACLREGQRDDCLREADDDFGGWVKTPILFLAVSGPKFKKFSGDVNDFS